MVVLEKQSSANDRVERYFRRMLAKTEHGQRLPSVREVMKECNASRVMVDKALSRLQGEGLIETRERSGLFRTQRLTTNRAVDLLYFGYLGSLERGTFHSEFFSTLTTMLAERSQSLRMRVMRKDPDPRACVEELIRQRPGQVIVCEANLEDMAVIEKLKEAGINYLHVFPNIIEPISPSLLVDDEDMLRQQMGHLAELGHRHVAFLHAADPTQFARPLCVRRWEFFRLAWEYGFQIRPEWIRFVGWGDPEKLRSEVRRMMGQSLRPTGMIIYDAHVNPVYAELRACGLVPGRDISIVGTDDLPHAAHVDPGLTTVRISRTEAVERTLKMLEELQAGGHPEIQRMKTKLIVRGSTVKIT